MVGHVRVWLRESRIAGEPTLAYETLGARDQVHSICSLWALGRELPNAVLEHDSIALVRVPVGI